MKTRTSRWIITLVCAFALASQTAAFAPAVPDDCNLPFRGSYRKAVKNRLPSARSRDAINSGNAIEVRDWFRTTQQFDTQLQARRVTKPRTNTPPMRGIETSSVNLHCFIVVMKQEPDNDLHVEVAGEPKWDTDHVVVEVPPGQAYCDARKMVGRLVRSDRGTTRGPLPNVHIFNQPAEVNVEGLVFLDGIHVKKGTIHFADAKGKDAGRGLSAPGKPRRVRGLWEIHPVFAVRPAM